MKALWIILAGLPLLAQQAPPSPTHGCHTRACGC